MAEDNEERTIELTIEALTGTVYDLCVSPYETILGIKLKVQRLEGIPVYQQQLVWGGLELQDGLCLEEYSIPSGAQLKLLVAMRGGPIHAQRVHLDLEDPTLLEIAELLDSQGGDKYTLMLLRNGDDLDHASFVQVQMLDDDDDVMRLSPIHVAAAESQHVGVATSKNACAEHAVTRDKMKELMAKFKKEREFRQEPHTLPSHTSNQLSRKGTGKVLILDSRASSRLLNSSSRVTPLSALTNETRLPQRKLVFPGDPCPRLRQSGKQRKRMTSCSLASSADDKTPIISRKTRSRVGEADTGVMFSRLEGTGGSMDTINSEVDYTHIQPAPKRADLPWHKPSKRKRRTSSMDPDPPSLATIGDLSRKFSHLEMNHALPTIEQSPCASKDRTEFLPPIVCPRLPTTPYITPQSLSQPLPSLSIASTNMNMNMSTRKKRCMKCGKKMGLASTYSCRCGGLFCAIHRYAESHSCTFDYKTEGRQFIARTNPVVAAQKLPKI